MNPSLVLIAQLLAIGAIFYFLIIRPQSAARARAEAMLNAMKKGDTVVTAGGIVGKVKDIKDSLITIESGTSSLVVERARIVRVGDQSAPGPNAR